MARTQPTGKQIADGSIQRDDLDVTTAGQAVITKLVQGTGLSLSATGADAGTGDVTATLASVIPLVLQLNGLGLGVSPLALLHLAAGAPVIRIDALTGTGRINFRDASAQKGVLDWNGTAFPNGMELNNVAGSAGLSLKATVGLIQLATIAAQPIIFYTNSLERLRIDDQGVMQLKDRVSAPTGVAGASEVYSESGELKHVNPSGTVTALTPASGGATTPTTVAAGITTTVAAGTQMLWADGITLNGALAVNGSLRGVLT